MRGGDCFGPLALAMTGGWESLRGAQRRRNHFRLWAVLACWVISLGVWAAPEDAHELLSRIQAAARQRNFVGTMVFTAGDVVSSSRVAHFTVGQQSYERVEALDGQLERVYRHNQIVHSFWPQARVATVERRDASTSHPMSHPMWPELDARVQEVYDARVVGIDRIAGRVAQVLMMRPRDEWRFAQRLWADEQTGLMLRADVMGPQGAVLESTAFTDVQIGARPQQESVLGPMKQLSGWRVVSMKPMPTQLEVEGWMVNRAPAGFRLLGVVKRPVAIPDAGSEVGRETAAAQTVQAVFSDGLARVSVFIEPRDPAAARQPLLTQMGATHTLMKPHSERWWVTVMGDVPAATLKQFHAALVRRPS